MLCDRSSEHGIDLPLEWGGSFLTFFRNLRTLNDKKWNMHEKFVCTKYQPLGGGSSTSAGGLKLQFFEKKRGV